MISKILCSEKAYALLTLRSRVLEKPTGSKLVKKYSPHFMEAEGSLPRLYEPTSCSYSEPDQSSPFPHPSA